MSSEIPLHSIYLVRKVGIDLPNDFFDEWLEGGRVMVLLDGLDEVADPDLRRRVARLVEAFTCAYPACRFVITSRVVGYEGAARLGEKYHVTIVRDFTLNEVESFLRNWHRLVSVGQMGPGESAVSYGESQTAQLMGAIRGNDRIAAYNGVVGPAHKNRRKWGNLPRNMVALT